MVQLKVTGACVPSRLVRSRRLANGKKTLPSDLSSWRPRMHARSHTRYARKFTSTHIDDAKRMDGFVTKWKHFPCKNGPAYIDHVLQLAMLAVCK